MKSPTGFWRCHTRVCPTFMINPEISHTRWYTIPVHWHQHRCYLWKVLSSESDNWFLWKCSRSSSTLVELNGYSAKLLPILLYKISAVQFISTLISHFIRFTCSSCLLTWITDQPITWQQLDAFIHVDVERENIHHSYRQRAGSTSCKVQFPASSWTQSSHIKILILVMRNLLISINQSIKSLFI